MKTVRLHLVTTVPTTVEVLLVPLLVLVTTTMLLRTAGDAEVAAWLAAQAVVTAANLWSLGRNDLLMASLIDHSVQGQSLTGVAAMALARAERPTVWLALAWGALGGVMIARGSTMLSVQQLPFVVACAFGSWCRLRETMAVSAIRGTGDWPRAALFSAAARSSGALLALLAIALRWPLSVAIALQSIPGLAARLLAFPRAATPVATNALPVLTFRRTLPFFMQMAGNALLHTLDRLVALPLLGVVGAARYGIISQLTTPLYGVVWGSFIWMVDRRVAGSDATPPSNQVLRRLVAGAGGMIILLIAAWAVAIRWIVPPMFGGRAPHGGDIDLRNALLAAIAFSAAVPPYYLMFRRQQGRLTGALAAGGALLWGAALLVPATATSPTTFTAARAMTASLLACATWLVYLILRSRDAAASGPERCAPTSDRDA